MMASDIGGIYALVNQHNQKITIFNGMAMFNSDVSLPESMFVDLSENTAYHGYNFKMIHFEGDDILYRLYL